MQQDRYGLELSTRSAAARDDYVLGCDLLLSVYPGAAAAFDRAIAADPGFALAYAGKARQQHLRGDMADARVSMAAANAAAAAGVTEREASHLAFMGLLVTGQSAAAIAALRAHLAVWPRDAMVLATSVSANGLIGSSGRVGQKREIQELADSVAEAYGDDWWFTGHHGFTLAENGQHAAARRKIEHSLARNLANAYGAHTHAHFCYEAGELDEGRDFLRGWLVDYPRDGGFRSHLSWHLALFELKAGNDAEALRLYSEIVAPEVNHDPPISVLANAASFLWRWDLAGHSAGPERWQAMHAFVRQRFPHAGNGYADWHAVLTEAAVGDSAGLEARVREMEDLDRDGRYPPGEVGPAVARGFAAFARRDFDGAIASIEPVWAQRDRLSGSLAQTDLVEFTLLKAYAEAGRTEDVQRMLAARRAGAVGAAVAGVG